MVTARVLTPESYKLIFKEKPLTDIPNSMHLEFSGDVNTSTISHGGSDPGVLTNISIDLAENTGHFIMTNIGNRSIDRSEIGQLLKKIEGLINDFETSD